MKSAINRPTRRIGVHATLQFRQDRVTALKGFIQDELSQIAQTCQILCTQETYELIMDLIDDGRNCNEFRVISPSRALICENRPGEWRDSIRQNLVVQRPGLQGVIELAHELVEGRLDGVIQLTSWEEASQRIHDVVLRREANVHNVPFASNIRTARRMIEGWVSPDRRRIPTQRAASMQSVNPDAPLAGLTASDRVLAMIAHDNLKLDLCCFMVEQATEIFDRFDYILATGTTGKWLKQFVRAAGYPAEFEARIRPCLSGPYGGDIQIAAAIVKGLCQKVIFLQDPFTSHAHESDIKLVEQSILMFDQLADLGEIDIEFATNLRSARAILNIPRTRLRGTRLSIAGQRAAL